MKIRVGYTEDWCGQATRKYQIVDETLTGRYVCTEMPMILESLAGLKYIAYGNAGLFLRDKRDFPKVTEEELEI